MEGPTTVMTVGNPAAANKSIIREKLNAQIHLLYARKVFYLLFSYHFFLILLNQRSLTNV
jgi:hypothetical protein